MKQQTLPPALVPLAVEVIVPSEIRSPKPWLWVLGPAVLFLAVTTPWLGDYGPGWDFGVVYYGERYLDFYLGGFDASCLDFGDDGPTAGTEVAGANSPDAEAPASDRFEVARLRTQGPELSWPVGPLLAAACRRIMHGWLHLLDPDEGYHLACLLLTALCVGALCGHTRRTVGRTAALAAAFFVATYPAFLGLSFHDPKDIPAAVFFTLAVLTGARAAEIRTLRSTLLFGVVLGLALGAKTNALFVPVILLVWWVICRVHRSTRLRLPLRVWIGAFVAVLVVAPIIFFLVWPWLWIDPLHNLAAHMERIWEDRYGAARLGQSFLEAALTTPPPVLLFVLPALFLWRQTLPPRSRRTLLLALVWLAIPLLRASAPNVRYYDGVRRFIEFVPPLALLAGIGVQALGRSLGHLFARWRLGAPQRLGLAALTLAVLSAGIPAVTTHPDQVAYYNSLVGGTLGAQAAGYEAATDLWATSYRRAMEWLAREAPPDATVLVPVAPHVARMARDLHGRRDLRISSPPFLDPEQIPAGSFYVLYVTKRTYYDAVVRVCEAMASPVIEWKLEGAPLCRLFRIDAGSKIHALIRQAAQVGRGLAQARRDALAEKIRRPDPDPRAVGAYAHTIVQLDGIDAALAALDEVIDRIEDPALRREVLFFRDQIDRSRPYDPGRATAR